MTAKDLWSMTKQAFGDWSEDKASRLAAALAYYAAFSLAPIMVIAVLIAGIVMQNSQEAENKVVEQMSQLVSGVSQDEARGWIDAAKKSGGAWWATILSILLLLWSASNVFAELQDSMNTIWEVQPKPDAGWWQWFRKRFLSMAMVLGIAFLLLVSLVVSTILTGMAGTTMNAIGLGGEGWIAKTIGIVLDLVISLGVVTLLFAAIFKFLPDVKIRWRDVWVGAIVTGVLFTVGRYGLSLYFAKAAPTSAFGAAGSLAALLLWVYYAASILFLGAEFTQVYARRYGGRIEPSEHAEPIDERSVAKQKKTSGGPQRPQTQQAFAPSAARGREGRSGAGAAPYGGPAIVQISRPVVDPGLGKLVAAGGVAAGVAVGAASLLAKRFIGSTFYDKHVARRLNDIEYRIAEEKALRRYGVETDVRQRVAALEDRITAVARQVPRHARPVAPETITERLREIEHHFAMDRGLRRTGQHMNVQERLDRIETRVRDLHRAHRRRTSKAPAWLQRIGEAVMGE